jgi:hypothetical protein
MYVIAQVQLLTLVPWQWVTAIFQKKFHAQWLLVFCLTPKV